MAHLSSLLPILRQLAPVSSLNTGYRWSSTHLSNNSYNARVNINTQAGLYCLCSTWSSASLNSNVCTSWSFNNKTRLSTFLLSTKSLTRLASEVVPKAKASWYFSATAVNASYLQTINKCTMPMLWSERTRASLLLLTNKNATSLFFKLVKSALEVILETGGLPNKR